VAGLVVVLVAAVVVAWVVISREEEPPSTGPAVSVSTPPADGGMFSSPEGLIQKAGSTLPCGDAVPTEAIGAVAQVWCADGSVVIRVYDGIEGVNDAIDLKRVTGGDLLTGQNWTVNADDPQIMKAAQQVLGGQLLSFGEGTACRVSKSMSYVVIWESFL